MNKTALSTLSLLALAMAAAQAPVQAQGMQQSPNGYASTTNRMIVKYRDPAQVSSTMADANGKVRHFITARNRLGVQMATLREHAETGRVYRFNRHLSVEQVRQLADELRRDDANILYAEPDRIMKPLAVPADPGYAKQWHYFEATGGLNLPKAWDLSTGTGVTVAVIDTGFRPHADLKANLLPGYDFIGDTFVSNDGDGRDADASDTGDAILKGECGGGQPLQDNASSWHGTHVAGTIAAVAGNGIGGVGVAYGAKVVPVRVLGKCGGYTSDIADGITWAAGGTVAGVPANANPARVLNLSLGGEGACDTTTQNAINTARSRGAVVVVAAGNDNLDASAFSPANCQGVITVAAVNRKGGRAWYSNFGTSVELAAPGGDTTIETDGIYSTLNAGTKGPGADNYAFYQGTSMATPHVAGAAALVIAAKPTATVAEVEAALLNTVRPFPATCTGCGKGIVDAYAAVQYVKGGSTTPPSGTTVSEVESNNTRALAQSISGNPVTVNGTMSASTDVDYFKVSLPAGKTLAAVLAPNASSDYDLYIENATGTVLAKSENGTGAADSASAKNSGTTATTVYVRVKHYGGGTGATNGKYTLKLSF